MAKQIITSIVDDLDGGEADETVTFAVDGYSYEIDLSTKNASAFRSFMAKYQEAGTRLGRANLSSGPQMRSYRSASSTSSKSANRDENQKIRLWAGENGYELSERGRIPQHIQDAYNTGTPSPAALLEKEVAEPEVATPRKRATKKAAPAAAFTS